MTNCTFRCIWGYTKQVVQVSFSDWGRNIKHRISGLDRNLCHVPIVVEDEELWRLFELEQHAFNAHEPALIAVSYAKFSMRSYKSRSSSLSLPW